MPTSNYDVNARARVWMKKGSPRDSCILSKYCRIKRLQLVLLFSIINTIGIFFKSNRSTKRIKIIRGIIPQVL